MKIALLVPGGVDRTGEYRVIPCLLWLIERLAREHELHVYATAQEPRPSRYPLLGATVHNIGARPRRVRLLATILAHHRRGRFDVLHAVWAYPQGMIAGLAGRLLRVPVLLRLTGGDLARVPEIGYGLLARRRGGARLDRVVRGAAYVTVPSTAMREAAQRLGIEAERLPYGVALDRWPPRAPRPRTPGAPGRLLHVASLNAVKDQTTLLRAVRILADRDVAFHLDVVGEDTLGGVVQRLASDLRLDDRVTFHGFLPQGGVRPLMERADLFVFSSRHEADPVVLLEAAVAGVPAVGTRVGHMTSWAPGAAAAVPVGDHEALAGEIAALLADDPRRLRMAAAAQALAVAEDADWTARRVLALYHDLAHARSH